MDDGLVVRWRRGDARAAAGIRQRVGTLISALWDAAAADVSGAHTDASIAIDDRFEKRNRLGRAVREVLSQGPASWDEVSKRCVESCARQRASAMVASVDGEHPAVHALVSSAMRDPIEAPTELHRAVGAHVPTCKVCTDVLRSVRSMERAARNWRPADAVVFEDDSTDPGIRKRPPERSARTRSSRQSDTSRGSPMSTGKGLWPVIVVGAFLVWWKWGTEQPIEEQPDLRYAALVDRTPPEVPAASSLPQAAQDVLQDLRRGDCFTASARGRAHRQRRPNHVELSLLVGASFVCAGDGAAAEEVLTPLLERVPGGQVPWLIAQAHLLQGHPEQATVLLEQVSREDRRLRAKADALLSLIVATEASSDGRVEGL